MSEDEVTRLREENAKLVARDQEWWRAACDLFNADEGTPAEAAALGALNALKTGCGWSDVPEPMAKLLCDQRDAALAEVARLRAENERLEVEVEQYRQVVQDGKRLPAPELMQDPAFAAFTLGKMEEENERLRGCLCKANANMEAAERALYLKLQEVEAENERLRAALKPFAAVASWPDVSEGACSGSGPIPDRYAMTWAVVTEAEAIDGGPTPTVGDCRRAAELLAGSPAPA